MAKSKQEPRDPIQRTVFAQEMGKKYFPTFVEDKEAMELAEDYIFDLLKDNEEKSEAEIFADLEEAIIAAKAVDATETPRPDRVFTMFDRIFG